MYLKFVEGIRTAIKAKTDHAYKIAYLKCTLNLNSNSKNEAFSLNRSRENKGQSWYIWEHYFGVILQIFTTWHAIKYYEFQVSQGKIIISPRILTFSRYDADANRLYRQLNWKDLSTDTIVSNTKSPNGLQVFKWSCSRIFIL